MIGAEAEKWRERGLLPRRKGASSRKERGLFPKGKGPSSPPKERGIGESHQEDLFSLEEEEGPPEKDQEDLLEEEEASGAGS